MTGVQASSPKVIHLFGEWDPAHPDPPPLEPIPRQRFAIIYEQAIWDLDHASFHVLAAFTLHADKDGWCNPSRRTLAAKFQITERQLDRQIDDIVEQGFLEKGPRRRRKSRKYRVIRPQRDLRVDPEGPVLNSRVDPEGPVLNGLRVDPEGLVSTMNRKEVRKNRKERKPPYPLTRGDSIDSNPNTIPNLVEVTTPPQTQFAEQVSEKVAPPEKGLTKTNPDEIDRVDPQKMTIAPVVVGEQALTEPGGNDFDVFWQLYPRKVDKIAARKKWDTVTQTTDPAEIIAGLERLLPTLAQQEERFTKHPATWLSKGSWANEIPPPTGVAVRKGPLSICEHMARMVSALRHNYPDKVDMEIVKQLRDEFFASNGWHPTDPCDSVDQHVKLGLFERELKVDLGLSDSYYADEAAEPEPETTPQASPFTIEDYADAVVDQAAKQRLDELIRKLPRGRDGELLRCLESAWVESNKNTSAAEMVDAIELRLKAGTDKINALAYSLRVDRPAQALVAAE